jgi:hypothetical protein
MNGQSFLGATTMTTAAGMLPLQSVFNSIPRFSRDGGEASVSWLPPARRPVTAPVTPIEMPAPQESMCGCAA